MTDSNKQQENLAEKADEKIDPNKEKNQDNRICFCHGVSEGEIRQAIRGGAKTVEAIQNLTQASTGCGGCLSEVERILQEELSKKG